MLPLFLFVFHYISYALFFFLGDLLCERETINKQKMRDNKVARGLPVIPAKATRERMLVFWHNFSETVCGTPEHDLASCKVIHIKTYNNCSPPPFSPTGVARSPGKPKAWLFLLYVGFHALRGIFFAHYVTRFVLVFLLLPYSPASLATDKPGKHGVLDVEKGSFIALFSFINMHLQYMVLAVIKDSLPAVKAYFLRVAREYLSAFLCCKCCQGGGRGWCSAAVRWILAVYNRIPCRPGILLTTFMCLLWVPLHNLGGLAIYLKVVLSCLALFLFIEESLPPLPATASVSPVMQPMLAAPAAAAPGHSPAPPSRVSRSFVHSRRSSSPASSQGVTSSPSFANETATWGGNRSFPPPNPLPVRRIPAVRGVRPRLWPSVWWLCEALAGAGAALVTCFSHTQPTASARDGQPSLVPILLITGCAGVCFIAGMHQTGMAATEATEVEISSPASATSLLPPALTTTVAEEPPPRSLVDFIRAVTRTCKRPSMQAMCTVMALTALFESFIQQYLLLLLLSIAPPGAALDGPRYYILPLALLGSWVMPLVVGNILEFLFRTRCPLDIGSMALAALACSGCVLLTIGFAGTGLFGWNIGDDQTAPPPAAYQFSEKIFFMMILWLLGFAGLAGGLRRALNNTVAPYVVNEHRVIFRRCPSPYTTADGRRSSTRHSDNSDRIVEEIFSLLTLLSRSGATVVGCVFFWAESITGFGNGPPPRSVEAAEPRMTAPAQVNIANSAMFTSTEEAQGLRRYQHQLRTICFCFGWWISIAFVVGLYLWRRLYKLFGYHLSFVETTINALERERPDMLEVVA
eukprot:gene906-533_t